MSALKVKVRRVGAETRVCLDVDGFEAYLCDKAVRASVAASPMQRAMLVQALKAAGFQFDEDKLIKACIHVSKPRQPNSLRVRSVDRRRPNSTRHTPRPRSTPP